MVTQLKFFLKKRLNKENVKKLKALYSKFRKLGRSVKKPKTEQDLIRQLQEAGIGLGDTLIVHSSLSQLGSIDGGAEAVVSALQKSVGENGNLLMPVFTFDKFDSGEIVDLRTDRGDTGSIPNALMKCGSKVYRSSHPLTSVCAWGKDAEFLTNGHHLDSKIWHKDSPYARAHGLNGKFVGLGIDMAPLTFYHVVEDNWSGYPLEVYDDPFDATYIDWFGKKITRVVKRHTGRLRTHRIDQITGIWLRQLYANVFDKKGQRKTFEFGSGSSWVISCEDVFNTTKELAEKGVTIYTSKKDFDQLDFKI
jgi:aminoglycoside 3-N-acetyltransferase